MERMLSNALNHLMQGWMNDIMSFNFITEYLLEKDNILADALSRQYEKHMEHYFRHGNYAVSTSMPEETKLLNIIPEKEREKLIEYKHLLGHFSAQTMLKKLITSKRT